MAKIIALAGAHRVGKTSICKSVEQAAAETTGLRVKFVPASLSEACKQLNIDPSDGSVAFERRMENQNNLIKYFAGRVEEMLKMDCDFVITDRSPWDFYAYTILNAGDAGRKLTREQQEEVFKFEMFCKHFEPYFYHIVVVQPGIPLVPEPLKAELNPLYISALNDIIVGKITETQINANDYREQIGMRMTLPAELIDHAERCAIVLKLIQASQFTHH